MSDRQRMIFILAKALAERDGWDWEDMPPYRDGYEATAECFLECLKEAPEALLDVIYGVAESSARRNTERAT